MSAFILGALGAMFFVLLMAVITLSAIAGLISAFINTFINAFKGLA